MTDRRTDGRTDDGLCEQLYSAKSYIINQILKKKKSFDKNIIKKSSSKTNVCWDISRACLYAVVLVFVPFEEFYFSIVGEWLQIWFLDFTRHAWILSSEGYFAQATFIKITCKNLCQIHLLSSFLQWKYEYKIWWNRSVATRTRIPTSLNRANATRT